MIRTSSVVLQLQCPRCDVRVDGFDPEVFRGIQVCYKRRCEQHWWAMRLHAGAVEPQLADVFDALAPELIRTWALPRELDRPAFWQLSLSRNQASRLRASGSVAFLRLTAVLNQLQGALVSTGRYT